MVFDTLEDYDKELKEMEADLSEMEEYLKKHPDKFGTQGNYETYKYVYDIYKNDKIRFIEEINHIHLRLNNEQNNILNVTELNKVSNNFNQTEFLTTNLLSETTPNNEDLIVKEISQGSYKITFAFPNPTEEDVKRTSPRKKGLLKIFDFIKCGDDIEKLKKEAGPDGKEALKAYRDFLKEIVNVNSDFTLDTEKGTLKAGLTLQQCKNICKNLKI